MRSFWFLIFSVLVFSGCMTQYAKFPVSPNATLLSTPQNAPLLGLSVVQDDRESNAAGRVGGVKIAVGEDVGKFLKDLMKVKFSEAGFKVIDAPDPSQMTTEEIKDVFGSKIILPILRQISISTADSILIPADADINIALKVYGPDGNVLYTAQYMGKDSERIGLSGTGKKEGKILASAADNAIQQMLQDTHLLEALK